VRADFAAHYLVCGDHDEYMVRRWSLEVIVGAAIDVGLDKLLQLGKRGFAESGTGPRTNGSPSKHETFVLQAVNGLKTLGPYQGRPKQHVEQQ
jgi:hypothetical protein